MIRTTSSRSFSFCSKAMAAIVASNTHSIPCDVSVPSSLSTVCLHRYNDGLPDVYKHALRTEQRTQLEAIRTLARAILSYCDGGSEHVGSEDCRGLSQTGESYDRGIERDLAALERGLGRFLDLKYTLNPDDYPLVVSTLLRGALTYEVDTGLRSKLARTVVRLLRKRDCVLPDGVPWRAVLNMILRVHVKCVNGGPYIGKDIRDSHCRNMLSLLRKTRNFIPKEDDAFSIWSEYGLRIDSSRPDSAFESLLILAHILPTRGSASLEWLPEAFAKFATLSNSPDWDSTWLALFSRAAKHQPCAFDWSDHLPMLYSCLAASFKLPLGSAAPQSPVERRCPHHLAFMLSDKSMAAAANIAVYTQSVHAPAALVHFKRLISLISNYFHPSNGGRWTPSLGSFLYHLASALVNRVLSERSASRANVRHRVVGSLHVVAVAPEEHRLPASYVDEIVTLILPLIQQGLQSKSSSMSIQAASASRDLSTLSPHIVAEPLLAMASDCLGYISSPHRTLAALKMLSSLTPVFLDPALCSYGIEALPDILTLCLPGVDANDPSKTEATFRFIASVCARLQSLTSSGYALSSELICFLEDYTLQFVERIFTLLDSFEAPPKKGRNGTVPSFAGYQLSWFIFSVAVDSLLSVAPSSAVLAVAQRVARHISGSASLNALKFYGALVRTAASAVAHAKEAESPASMFIPGLLDDVLVENSRHRDGLAYELAALSEDELVWRIRMMAQICRVCGSDVCVFVDKLSAVISLSFARQERRIYKAAGRLLRGLLEGLTCIKGLREPAEGGSQKPSLLEDDTGLVCHSSYSVTWKSPVDDDWVTAERTMSRFLDEVERLVFCPEVTAVEAVDTDEGSEVCAARESLFRALRMLHAIQRGGRWIMGGAGPEKFAPVSDVVMQERFGNCDADTKLGKEDALLVLKKPVAAGLGGESWRSAGAVTAARLWNRTYGIIFRVLDYVVKSRPDDGALLYRCLEPIELAHEPFRRSSGLRLTLHACRGYKNAYTSTVALHRPFGAEGGIGRFMPEFICRLRVKSQHETRLGYAARPGGDCRPMFEKILKRVVDLSVNEFPHVRGEARGIVTRAWRVADASTRRQEIIRIVGVLSKAAEDALPARMLQYADMNGSAPQTKVLSTNNNEMQMSGAESQKTSATRSDTDDLVPSRSVDGPNSGDVQYETIIGACAMLRSSAAAPLIMREWDLFRLVMLAMLRAVMVADRYDAAGAIASLFMKLSSLARPFGLLPVELVGVDLALVAPVKACRDLSRFEGRLASYFSFQESLLRMVSRAGSSDPVSNGPVENTADGMLAMGASSGMSSTAEAEGFVHWRLQSLVAITLGICLREDQLPLPTVAAFFMKSMVSEVVSLRHIATKAVSLILAMHRSRIADRTSSVCCNMLPMLEGPLLETPSVMETIFTSQGFAKQLVHTLALDRDDGLSSDGSAVGQSLRQFGFMNVTRCMDGDACWSMIGGKPWPMSWVQRSRDAFNIAQIRLYELFCRVFERSAFKAFSDCVQEMIVAADLKKENIIEGVRDDSVRVVAGEVVGALARGLTVNENSAVDDQVLEWICMLLRGLTGPQGAIDGGALIRLVRTAEMGTVAKGLESRLLTFILSDRPVVSLIGDGSSGHLQARRLRYIHSFAADSLPNDSPFVSRIMEVVPEITSDHALGHELKNVREELARVLSLFAGLSSVAGADVYRSATISVAHRLARTSCVENVLADNDVREPPENEKALRSRQGETLSRWISILYWNGDSGRSWGYLPEFLPAIVSSLDEESDPDRVSHARLALSLAAQGFIDQDTAFRIAECCQDISKSPKYRVRGSMLPFLQVFSFSVLFTASTDTLDLMLAIVVRLLYDVQAEVRDAAAKTLVPMIRDATAAAVSRIREELVSVVRSSTIRATAGSKQNISSDLLCRRHGATLGLGSMIMAHPYDIPRWMPSVLVTLADCINDPQPISTSVKRTFADFMRTHRDEWQTHKAEFSESELERVSELLVSPSYYA